MLFGVAIVLSGFYERFFYEKSLENIENLRCTKSENITFFGGFLDGLKKYWLKINGLKSGDLIYLGNLIDMAEKYDYIKLKVAKRPPEGG